MRLLIILLVAVCCITCRDRYEYIADAPDRGILVVEGVVNLNGSSTIRLSRTTQLSTTGLVPEQGAFIHVEGDDGSVYHLVEQDSGRYFLPPVSIATDKKYRLKITTTAGNVEYASDYRSPLQTQLIDSINYRLINEGVQFYVNSSGSNPQKYYYKYELEETWQFNSSYISLLQFKVSGEGDDKKVSVEYYDPVNHSPNREIYTCWQSRISTSIDIGTTDLLTGSHIFIPVKFHRRNSIELGVMYSLMVRQFALSAEGYDFYRRMKKNTESLGSIFDANPSDISGNIQCITNPSETVVGFVEFTTVEEKRIFVRSEELPGTPYEPECDVFKGVEHYPYPFPNDPAILKFAYDSLNVLPTHFTEPQPGAPNYFMEKEECVDCTLTGTNVKPSFWP